VETPELGARGAGKAIQTVMRAGGCTHGTGSASWQRSAVQTPSWRKKPTSLIGDQTALVLS
jgi:hypothetical protein